MTSKTLKADRGRGFSLAEALIGIGMAAVLILSILALSTAALSGDQKAEMRQVALAMADAELNRFAREVSVANSAARNGFWAAGDGPYSGAGTQPILKANNTEFSFEYRSVGLLNQITGASLGNERENNRLRKVDLTVSWWNGDEGKPGYGQLAVKSTRLLRESDVREP